MASSKRNDLGFLRALWGASRSPHPHARSIVSNYERYEGLAESNEEIRAWTEGEIPFGFLEGTDIVAKLKLSALNRHCLIIGPSGVGKTNLAKILASELMRHVPMMIFDRTGDHVGAYSQFDPIIFPIRNIRINPNEEPPGVPYEDWLEIYASVLIHSLILTDVTRGSFMQLIRHTNEYFEGFEKGLRCSIYDQRIAIDELKPRSYRDSARMTYWSRLEDRFDSMLASVLGEIFGCYKGHEISWFLDKNIIFDCTGVSSRILKILIPILLTKIYCYKLYNKQAEKALHGIMLEEAEDVFGIAGHGSFLENPLDDLVRRVRGRGEFLIVINQTCTTLSTALRSNVYVQFMLGASNAAERTEMGRSIGLRDEQWEEALKLDTPRAFVSVEGKEPRLVSIPEYKARSQALLQKMIKTPDDLPFMPVKQSVKEELRNLVLFRRKVSTKKLRGSKAASDQEKLKELLLDVAKNPFLKYSERRSLSFYRSRSEMFEILNKAREMKLIRQVYFKTTKGPGQRGLYLELTAKGMDFLIANDLWRERKSYYQGKMGFLGSLILNEILAPHFRNKGYQVKIEGIDKGRDCDLGVLSKDGSKDIAVELSVTTDAQHEIENIRRNLEAGWKRVICVVVGIRTKDETIEESEEQTRYKLESFKKAFSKYLSKKELSKVTLTGLKRFRRQNNGP